MLRSPLTAAVALAAAGACVAAPEFSGQVRPEYFAQERSSRGPLALADSLAPGLVPLPASGPAIETELRASGHGLFGVGTIRQQRLDGQGFNNRAFVNEAYWAGGGTSWQFSAGKKTVGWDVGYGFRPNDVVEREPRRTLLATTPEGRPLAMAEYFDASTAWSFVLVNPTKPRTSVGGNEPALAARVYRRDGAVDWHGFARQGIRTGTSVGAATAWVATESVELHGSVRWLHAADSIGSDDAAIAGAPGGLVRGNPWLPATVRNATQALVGGTWTNAEQFSVLAEAWWDGTALSNAQWKAWTARNGSLAALVGSRAPVAAIAGNLAYQGSALDTASNLRRANLFVRASQTLDKWQPALDLLYMPEDRGRVVTASLGWQGDRVRFDGGLRVYGGPGSAVIAQVGTRSVAFVAGTWAF